MSRSERSREGRGGGDGSSSHTENQQLRSGGAEAEAPLLPAGLEQCLTRFYLRVMMLLGTADETTDTRTHLDPPLNMTQRAAEEQIGFIVSIIFNVLLFSASVIFCALWRVNVFKARRAASVRPPADTEMEPLGGDPDHVPNGGAHSAEP